MTTLINGTASRDGYLVQLTTTHDNMHMRSNMEPEQALRLACSLIRSVVQTAEDGDAYDESSKAINHLAAMWDLIEDRTKLDRAEYMMRDSKERVDADTWSYFVDRTKYTIKERTSGGFTATYGDETAEHEEFSHAEQWLAQRIAGAGKED